MAQLQADRGDAHDLQVVLEITLMLREVLRL